MSSSWRKHRDGANSLDTESQGDEQPQERANTGFHRLIPLEVSFRELSHQSASRSMLKRPRTVFDTRIVITQTLNRP